MQWSNYHLLYKGLYFHGAIIIILGKGQTTRVPIKMTYIMCRGVCKTHRTTFHHSLHFKHLHLAFSLSYFFIATPVWGHNELTVCIIMTDRRSNLRHYSLQALFGLLQCHVVRVTGTRCLDQVCNRNYRKVLSQREFYFHACRFVHMYTHTLRLNPCRQTCEQKKQVRNPLHRCDKKVLNTLTRELLPEFGFT